MTTPVGDDVYLPELPRPSLAAAVRKRSRLAFRTVDRLERENYRRQHPAVSAAPGVRLERRQGRLYLIRTVPGIGPTDADRLNRDLVLDVCEELELDHFVIPEPVGSRHRVGIAEEHWHRFVDRIIERGTAEPIYVGVRAVAGGGEQRRWSELTSDPRIRRALREQPWVEIFVPMAAGRSATPWLRGHGCIVERWARDADCGLSAPNHNHATEYLGTEAQRVVRVETAGRPVRSYAPLSTGHLFDPAFPIDAVYLWVDGSDPAWQERKLRAREPDTSAPAEDPAEAAARFSDNGELRYSFRSLELFAPWIRHVYLVTDAQVPAWLDQDHPRVTVVDHRDIFPTGSRLPTFNSHAIGANLHHIEGLSEHYLYLNDDLFFGRLTSPGLFFLANGVTQFHLSKSTLPTGLDLSSLAHEGARRNSAELLRSEFGRMATRAFYHVPNAQRRSVLYELERRFPDVFRQNSGSPFRSADDFEVNSWLYHYYAFFTERAVPGSIRYGYFDVSRPDTEARMDQLLRQRDADTFCINDTVETSAERRQWIPRWLQRYFPQRSSFEKDGS